MEIKRMNIALKHRGPDGEGTYISPNGAVALGHRRLAIIDTSKAGHQPMTYMNRYHITFNGEIYNYKHLRTKLQQDGYSFASHTDTEVILALYDQYKTDCLQYLRGMFAFALYDQQEEVLFCARDRAGQKPFKYFASNQVFVFASELKAILTQPEYKRELDYEAIHHYLTYQYVPAPKTGFADVQKLEPGHYLHIDIKRKQIHKRRYWQLNFSCPESRNEDEWTEAITKKLDEATELQLVSDVPLGAFLSGGIDSSAVVASMVQQTAKKVKTFSIGFSERTHDERAYARQVADYLDTDHTEFTVRPETIEILPDLVSAFEEPYADSSAVPTYYLSKLARQHVTVALNGDGGDENFAGYTRYNFHKLALMLDKAHATSLPGTRTFARLLATTAQNTFTMRAARFLTSLPDQPLRRYVAYHCYFTNNMKQALYQPTFLQQTSDKDSYNVTPDVLTESSASLFDQALDADIRMYLPDDLLVKVDIASMMNSLEARSPFLDHEFLELTARIPHQLKLKGLTQNKYIFKRAMHDRLPVEVISRPKMGFIIPIERWFRGNMKDYLASVLLSKSTLITQEICRPEAVQRLLHQHTTTKTNFAPPLWALLTLELWMRKYFS